MNRRIPRIVALLFAFSMVAFLLMAMSVHVTPKQYALDDMPEWNDAAMLSNVLESKQERIADMEQKLQEEYDDYYRVLDRQRTLLAQEAAD